MLPICSRTKTKEWKEDSIKYIVIKYTISWRGRIQINVNIVFEFGFTSLLFKNKEPKENTNTHSVCMLGIFDSAIVRFASRIMLILN